MRIGVAVVNKLVFLGLLLWSSASFPSPFSSEGSSSRYQWIEGQKSMNLERREEQAKPMTSQYLRDSHLSPRVNREVIGYLPYWTHKANAPYVFPRWDLLTIVAWFHVDIDSCGNAVDRHGWGASHIQDMVDEAHRHGVRVVLTVTLFDNTDIATLVNSPSCRANTIANALSWMREHGIDGINIDFETVPLAGRNGFVTFMKELTAAVRAERPNGGPGHVTLAGPAVDWSGSYHFKALLEETDGIIVMGYDYHWSKGDPGPVAPLFGGDPWAKHSIAWSIDDYLHYGGEDNRDRLYMALPWYGQKWPVASEDIPGVSLGTSTSVTFAQAEQDVRIYEKSLDEVARSNFYHKMEGAQLFQAWYEDRAMYRERVAYVDDMDLGGIGIWALGYEGASDALWDTIDEILGEPLEPPLDDEEDAGSSESDANTPGEDSSEGDVLVEEDAAGGTDGNGEVGTSHGDGSYGEEDPGGGSGKFRGGREMSWRLQEGSGCQGSGKAPLPWLVGGLFVLALRLGVKRMVSF